MTKPIERFPATPTVSFKFQLDMDHEALMRIARNRLQAGHFAVIANRGEERGPDGEQIAHLVQRDAPPMPMVGRPAIAAALADFLEAPIADVPEARTADIPGGGIAGALR